MADKPTDRVISYAMYLDGKKSESGPDSPGESLQGALAEGYRVVDVISTPVQGGNTGYCVITVLLTQKDAKSCYRQKAL